MIDSLHNLFEMLAHLPESYQQEAMRRIQPIVDELDDCAWDEAFADPRSDAFFAEAEADLERERAAGTLRPLEEILGEDGSSSPAGTSFWRLFAALSPDVTRQAQAAFATFDQDPFHPRLHFKPIKGRPRWWSARIDGGYRAVGDRHGDQIDWFWIGDHDGYLRLLRQP